MVFDNIDGSVGGFDEEQLSGAGDEQSHRSDIPP
jgi:hypothetical protein